MSELEKYIRENAETFDVEELPAGHLERFTSKLDGVLKENTETRTLRPRWNVRYFAIGIAAAAAILLTVGTRFGKMWGNDPAGVYRAYSDRTAALYGKALAKDYDGSVENTLRSITEEAIPLIDQLPDELDDATKAAILREYYGKLLDGVRKVNRSK